MPVSGFKIELRVCDLRKAQAFYSAIGMEWAGESDVETGVSRLPRRVQENPYLKEFPLLWGTLGQTDFVFYLSDDAAQPSSQNTNGTFFRVRFNSVGDVKGALKTLRSLQLLVYASRAKPEEEPTVLDPDGRSVTLCAPSPFMNAD
jgi:hypothetical protein